MTLGKVMIQLPRRVKRTPTGVARKLALALKLDVLRHAPGDEFLAHFTNGAFFPAIKKMFGFMFK